MTTLAELDGDVEAQVAANKQPKRSPWDPMTDHSLLVEIYLWEKDLEAAWGQAQAGGCNESLWMVLANKRVKEHPEDALPIYQRHVEHAANRTNNDAYAEAVKLLRQVEDLMSRLGRERDFVHYLQGIRTTYKRKRNFMRLLARAKWRRTAE